MKQDEQPLYYQETPVPKLRIGQAVQHDGSNESAIEIVKWLKSQNIEAWMIPSSGDFSPSVVKVVNAESRRNSFGVDQQYLGPQEWVLIEPDGLASIFGPSQFKERFTSGGATSSSLYKQYNVTEIEKETTDAH